MFKKSFVYFFKATASSVNNNVIAFGDKNSISCGIIHKDSIFLISGPDTTNISSRQILCHKESEYDSNIEDIISLFIINFMDNDLLAVLKENSFYMYESNGSMQFLFYNSDKQESDCCFTCVTVIKSNIFIADSKGEIHIYESTLTDKPLGLRLIKSQILHNSSILTMSSSEDYLLSVDDENSIKFWKFSSVDTILQLISKCFVPANVLLSASSVHASVCTMINESNCRAGVVGFSNGMLHLYNCETGRILVEVSAHARIITGLAITSTNVQSNNAKTKPNSGDSASASATFILISVAHDTICRIWKLVLAKYDLSEKSSATMSLLQSIIVPDKLLQGVAFTSRQKLEFVLTSYDCNEAVSFIGV